MKKALLYSIIATFYLIPAQAQSEKSAGTFQPYRGEDIAGLAFLKQSMNIGVRDYCQQLEKTGYQLYANEDGTMLYEGTVNGVPETLVLVSGTPDMLAVANVMIIFPKERKRKGENEYKVLQEKFVNHLGAPFVEKNKRSESMAVWNFAEIMIMLSIDKGEVSLVISNNEIEEK